MKHFLLLLFLLTGLAASAEWQGIAPRGMAAQPVFFREGDGYGIELKSKLSIGYYERYFELPDKPDMAVRILGEAVSSFPKMLNDVEMTLSWYDRDGKMLRQDYVENRDQKGVRVFDWTTPYRPKAVRLRVRCYAKWQPGKTVFRNLRVSFVPVPKPRMVRLVTVPLRIRRVKPGENRNTLEHNLACFAAILDKVGQEVQKPDLILLPECMSNIYTGKEYPERAEAVPGGPTWQTVSKYAKKYHTYIIAGAIQRGEDGAMYNVAFIADRQGKFVGLYRKVHLVMSEIENGLTPGHEFPVFQLDFGKIGIMICWDNWFSEPARYLKLKGAELLVYPFGGDSFEHRQKVWPSRAVDNSIPMVCCMRYGGWTRSCIIDRQGVVRAATNADTAYAVSDIDLNCPQETDSFILERRPDVYFNEEPVLNTEK